MRWLIVVLAAVLVTPGIVVVMRGKPLLLSDRQARPAEYWRRQGVYYAAVVTLLALLVILFVGR